MIGYLWCAEGMGLNRPSVLLLWITGLLALALVAGGQVAELTRWPLPSGNALPYGIGGGTDGLVYFAEFSLDRIGQLDPVSNEVRERNVGDGPFGLVMGDGSSLHFTLSRENALELLVFVGGGAKWALPTPGAGPEALVAAPAGPGRVNLWFNERNAKKVVRFSPATVAVTLPLIVSPPQPVTPLTTQVTPVVTAVVPEDFPGNPMLPPPIALLVPKTSGPFTEWASMITDRYLERVAVAPAGRVWFTHGVAPLSVLDPETNTVLLSRPVPRPWRWPWVGMVGSGSPTPTDPRSVFLTRQRPTSACRPYPRGGGGRLVHGPGGRRPGPSLSSDERTRPLRPPSRLPPGVPDPGRGGKGLVHRRGGELRGQARDPPSPRGA